MLTNKSITIGESLETTGTALVTATVAGSKLLSYVGNTPLKSKTTLIPFTAMPASDDSEYVVGGLEATKKIFTVPATITDETMEDANFDIGGALVTTVTNQIKIKVEETAMGELKAAIAVTPLTENSTAISTIQKLLAEFKGAVLASIGDTVVAVSYATYYTLLLDTDNLVFLKEAGLRLVPSLALEDEDVIIIKPHGAVIGLAISGLEKERKGASGSTSLNAQGTLGTAFSPEYVKRSTF